MNHAVQHTHASVTMPSATLQAAEPTNDLFELDDSTSAAMSTNAKTAVADTAVKFMLLVKRSSHHISAQTAIVSKTVLSAAPKDNAQLLYQPVQATNNQLLITMKMDAVPHMSASVSVKVTPVSASPLSTPLNTPKKTAVLSIHLPETLEVTSKSACTEDKTHLLNTSRFMIVLMVSPI